MITADKRQPAATEELNEPDSLAALNVLGSGIRPISRTVFWALVAVSTTGLSLAWASLAPELAGPLGYSLFFVGFLAAAASALRLAEAVIERMGSAAPMADD